MNKDAYYLLLGALASAAIAGCGDDADDCPHSVVLKQRELSVTPEAACQSVGATYFQFGAQYGVPPDQCSKLCNDSSMNHCELSQDYLVAFEATNGPIESAPDAGAPATCPAWEGQVFLECSRQVARGSWHEGCPVDGRRPRGLRTLARSADAEVGSYLARSAHLEAASVLAFEKLAEDLSRLGAPEQLVADCREAAREEVSHARIVGALACARGAEVPEVQLHDPGTPSPLELALENVVEGVVRETYGAVQAIIRSRTASARDVRSALVRIAVEEASHAALSARIALWLETQLSAEERAQVSHAKQIAIADLRRELSIEPSPALREELGLPSSPLALSLVDQLEARVWQHAA